MIGGKGSEEGTSALAADENLRNALPDSWIKVHSEKQENSRNIQYNVQKDMTDFLFQNNPFHKSNSLI